LIVGVENIGGIENIRDIMTIDPGQADRIIPAVRAYQQAQPKDVITPAGQIIGEGLSVLFLAISALQLCSELSSEQYISETQAKKNTAL
jgi:hypothetical protein